MEAGTHSIWISEQLQELGHEVIVANVRELRAISQTRLSVTRRELRTDHRVLHPASIGDNRQCTHRTRIDKHKPTFYVHYKS